MRDLLGRVGEMALLAIAAPFIAADAVRDVRRSGEDVAAARAEALRLEGELDEARRAFDLSDRKRIENMAAAARFADRVAAILDELKIAQRERDGYWADVAALDEAHTLTAQALDNCKRERDVAYRSCTELQSEVDTAWAERDTAELRALNLQKELAAMRAPGLIEPCSWCLGESEHDNGFTVAGQTYHLCRACFLPDEPTGTNIIDRVAARLASCPTRRTSPDPHAAECSAGCGALAGEPCKAAS